MPAEFTLLAKAAPALPELTCPKIDAVLEEINYAKDLVDQIPADQAHCAFNILAGLSDDDGLIEGIRSANDQLRRNGAYWFREARKLSSETAELRSEIARLRGEKTDAAWVRALR